MENTTDAYFFAKKQVNELLNNGMDIVFLFHSIEIEKSKLNFKSYTNNIKSYYNNTPLNKRLDHLLWCKIFFKNLTKQQKEKIIEVGNYLGLCGITFDCGGGMINNKPYRQWEFDWSFEFTKGKENIEWRIAREELEDRLNEQEIE